MNQFNLNVISIISAALNKTTPKLSDDVDFEAIFKTYPRLTPLLYFGAIKSPLFKTCKCKPQILKLLSTEIAKCNKQMEYLNALCKRFDTQGIDYCLLKGCETRNLYPNPVMRPMKDCDILIKQEQYNQIKEIMMEEGYFLVNTSNHDFSWGKKDGYQIELHYRLFEEQTGFKDANIFCIKSENHFLLPEYSFVYQIAHLGKHFTLYNPSIKSFLDIYIFKNAYKNMDYVLIQTLLNSLKIADFYISICEAMNSWFNETCFSNKAEILTNSLLLSAYVKSEQSNKSLLNRTLKQNGKFSIKKFFKNYLFIPYKKMVYFFPVLKKGPVLLPLLWIYRINKIILKNITKESNSIPTLFGFDSKFYSSHKKNMKTLGLE